MTIDDVYTRDKQHFLEMMVDAIQDGIVVLDQGLKIIYANRWMDEKYAALTPLAGKTCHEVFNGSAEAWLSCPFIRTRESGKPQQQVVPYPPTGAPMKWFEISVFLLRDDAGRAIGTVGHVKDVTERRLTEERLRDEMIRRQILIEQSRDGIVLLDQNGKVFEANRRFADMLGYSMEEIQHLGVWDWDCKWTKIQLLEMAKTVDARGDHFETRHRRKDGTIYNVEISTNGAVFRGRKLIFCVCRDISDRKETEARLRDELIRRRILVEQSRDGIVVLDQNGKVAEANQRYAEMLGYPMDEIHHLHVWDWDVKWTREQLLEMIRTVDNNGDQFETRHRRKDGTLYDVEISTNGALFETRHRRKDGTLYDVEIKSNETVFQGQKLIFCVCRDITARRHAEDERDRLIRELREACKEIKTLRGILPFCSFCKKIRNDKGYWEQVDIYIEKYSHADITHGVCPECMRLHYPDLSE
jgi:PAS domain S-box-containing protein